MSEAEDRARVVAVARSWIGTPYHHNAAVKGAGVDCGRILVEIYAEAGLVPGFDPGYYAADWHLHRNEERYRETLERYLPRVDDDTTPLGHRGPGYTISPGDVVMWRMGRTFSHAAIVTDWPRILHSSAPDRMVLELDINHTKLPDREAMVFSFWSGKR